MKKVIRLTEADLTKIVKMVIEEQKKFELFVTQGSNAQGNLSKNILTITTESGRQQKFVVKTSLPEGDFMFEYGKDGRYYGFDKNGRKLEIKLLDKVK
jgi:hypothetical protein